MDYHDELGGMWAVPEPGKNPVLRTYDLCDSPEQENMLALLKGVAAGISDCVDVVIAHASTRVLCALSVCQRFQSKEFVCVGGEVVHVSNR